MAFGNASGAIPPFMPLELSPKSLSVRRANMAVYIQTAEEFASYATELMDMLSSGRLKITISAVYDLKDAGKAQDDLQVQPKGIGLISEPQDAWEIAVEDVIK